MAFHGNHWDHYDTQLVTRFRSVLCDVWQVALQEIDRVIGKFRDAQSEEELQSLVRVYVRQLDGDVMMRFRELGAAAEAPEQRLAYRNLSDRVMQIMETVRTRTA